MTYLTGGDKPSLNDIEHHGVKGMHWGQRRAEKRAIKEQTAAERAKFYQDTADNILKESLRDGDTLVALRHQGGTTIVTGRQFITHMQAGGLMDIKHSDIYATHPAGSNEPYLLNPNFNKPFVPSYKQKK